MKATHFALLACAFSTGLVASGPGRAFERDLLVNPSAQPGDEGGIGVALDAGQVASGAPGESAARGAAYVFDCSAAACAPPQRLAPGDLVPGDRFGAAVALSGDTLAISATGASPGAVYVYVRVAGNWLQQARIAPAGAAGEHFGIALALDSDTLVVGADRADIRAGAAYVFARTGTTWSPTARLTPADAHAGDGFGRSVALDAGTLLAGAPLAPGAIAGSFARGAAYVFTGSGATWTQQAKLVPAVVADGDSFGLALALEGDRAAIGAPMAQSRAGAVHVFERSGVAWSERARVVAPLGAAGDRFGWSVAIDADRLLVGAPYAYGSCGRAWLYRSAGSAASWFATTDADVAAALPETLAGWSVAIDGSRLAAAAPGYAAGDDHSGAVYYFDAADAVFADGFEPSALVLACE
ncbi:MAG: FG-GAP repeat protein [Dokdonella sp.]|uniref:FG-GAP repeat protein n=1 Tax=Dokdonella sp. TaxID=2291710 RepID=UPI003F80805C